MTDFESEIARREQELRRLRQTRREHEARAIIKAYGAQWRAGLERAIAAAGGVMALARALKISKQAITTNWRRVGRIPATRVLEVAKLTGIPLAELRPDVSPETIKAAIRAERKRSRSRYGAAA